MLSKTNVLHYTGSKQYRFIYQTSTSFFATGSIRAAHALYMLGDGGDHFQDYTVYLALFFETSGIGSLAVGGHNASFSRLGTKLTALQKEHGGTTLARAARGSRGGFGPIGLGGSRGS